MSFELLKQSNIPFLYPDPIPLIPRLFHLGDNCGIRTQPYARYSPASPDK